MMLCDPPYGEAVIIIAMMTDDNGVHCWSGHIHRQRLIVGGGGVGVGSRDGGPAGEKEGRPSAQLWCVPHSSTLSCPAATSFQHEPLTDSGPVSLYE